MLPFLIIISSWLLLLVMSFTHAITWWAPLQVLLIAYCYTGLFITAHDAMHGTAVATRRGNTIIGTICALLYAGMQYRRLYRNHHLHHAHPADAHADPDYHPSNALLPWYLTFMWRYTTWQQLLFMGVVYNLLALRIPEPRLWLFWIVPAFLSSFQLFYVGTYRPHRMPQVPALAHNARSMRANHVVAMLACYFFGYHQEHHASPGTPWWRLWRLKDGQAVRK